ncbi:MAG: glycosyltransferase [Clostridia bacterium]|nr:glycosyltransferase [Clostridia bacterium]
MIKLFLVVIYKEDVSSCKTLNSFKNIGLYKKSNNKFIVWDNSPDCRNESINLTDFFECNNIEYIHTPENTSLSKLYNLTIRNHNADLYCIFDQDSEISRKDYDSYLDSVVSENPDINIFLPQIFVGDKLYSPGRFWIFKGSHYKNLSIGVNKDSKYTAITSGIVIRNAVFKDEGIYFNEELTLYGIDTRFFNDYRKFDNNFFVLDVELSHDLSEEHLSRDERKKRVINYYDCLFKTENNILVKSLIYFYIFICKLIGKC